MRSATLVALVVLVAACGRSGAGARNAEMGSFHVVGVGAHVDPTLKPARLLPETVDETTTYGSEAGGGTRAITAGLRVVTSPKGAILAADDRFPQPPLATTAVPERLGGGFLFVVGSTLWRADRWLGPAKPIFTASQPVSAIIPGLDRVYVRSQNAVLAIDARSGRVLDLGPWPASPFVASYAAADGWRAAAVTDLRGLVATFDAGATWRGLDLPLDPKQIVVSGDNLAIGGFESGTTRTESWYELRPDGSLARLGAAPRDLKARLGQATLPARNGALGGFPGGVVGPATPPSPSSIARPTTPPRTSGPGSANEGRPPGDEQEEFATKTFGKRPLAAAIEDGWPLTDGTAVIARDGALARVRLSDGTLTEFVRDAFPLRPARCHPVSLTRPSAAGAFGFVCGEPRGATILYAYEPLRGRLAELKRFDKPRVVTSSGNGAIAVRGACAADAETPAPPAPQQIRLNDADDGGDKDRGKGGGASGGEKEKTKSKTGTLAEAPPGGGPHAKAGAGKDPPHAGAGAPAPEVHPYCVLGHDNAWREVHVRGDVGGERVVVLADGRIVVLSPPQGYNAPPRITILDKGRATTLPIEFPRVTNDVARVLRLGFWLDGFEERRPGVVGGWIEAGGAMLGLEITLEGKGTPGQYIRDAGFPFVSGKYGLGWTASRRGYETTDGGMSWNNIEVPDPLVPMAKVERRACGPIGCLANGWLRVGWGEPKREPPPPVPAAYRSANVPIVPQIQLVCEPTAPSPPAAPIVHAHVAAAHAEVFVPSLSGRSHFGGSGPPVLGTYQGQTELLAFFSHAAPVLREPDRGLSVDVRDLVERYPSVGPVARIYGWGPKTGDWDTLGRWQVAWLSPFAGWPEIHTSLPVPPPQAILDLTRQSGYTSFPGAYTGSYPGGSRSDYQLAPGDDPGHALLVGKRLGRTETALFELEADRAPVEIHRADGEPFGEIEGAVRATGRWFVSTASSSSASASASPVLAVAGASSSPFTVVWQLEGGVARELVRIPRALAEGPNSTGARSHLARRSDGRAIGLVVEGQPTIERPANVRWALPIDLESGAVGEPESLGYGDLAGRTVEGCTGDVVGWVLDTPIPASAVRVRLPQGSGTINSVQSRLRLTGEHVCVERLAGTYDGQSPERTAQLTRGGALRISPGPLRPGEMIVTAMSAQTRFPLRCTVGK